MTKSMIQRKLIESNVDLQKIEQALYEVREMDQSNDFNGYKEQSLEIVRRAERFACKLRELVSDTVFYDKKDLMMDIAKAQGITINQEENWLKVVMPFLLPKKKDTQSCSFILDPLNYAIRTFIEQNPMKRFDKCVVCFRNIYMPNGKVVRDHDNIETKKVLDLLATYFLIDDTGLLCSNFYTTTIGESEYTEIYIIPNEDFQKWLEIYSIQNVKNIQKSTAI